MSSSLENLKIGFIASGKMPQAIIKGILGSGMVKPSQVTMSDPNFNQKHIIEPLGVNITKDNKVVVDNSTLVFVGVKPHLIRGALREIKHKVTSDHIIVSIAAGISIETLESELPAGTRVIRVMPNTPALVQCGASVYVIGSHCKPEDGPVVKALCETFGVVQEIPERLMEACIGVMGSGPAYMYVAIEALADGGVKMGLPRPMALKLASQMVMGSGKMVLESGEHPGQLKDNVCSPGGTTICAVAELEQRGFRSALIHAVEAAANRSLELGAIDKKAAEAEKK